MQSLLISDDQRKEFELNGFLVIENVLTPAEVEKYLAIVNYIDHRAPVTHGGKSRKQGEGLELRNAVSYEPKLLDILMHERTFPLMVDLMGTNICMTTSHVFIRPPTPGAADTFKAIDWHKDGPTSDSTTPQNGRWPFLYAKIGYFLTDLTIPNAGALRVVPGSHRVDYPARKPGAADPYGYIEIQCKPGTAVIFENRLWHAVGPNYSPVPRKNIYIGYTRRWMRPIDYVTPDANLLKTASPVQRQLLGDVATPLGYIMPQAADIPLQAWRDQRLGITTATQTGGNI